MEAELATIRLNAIVQIAKWISYFIILGGSLSLTVAIMRLTGTERFKVGQVEVPLSRFVYVVAALTAAHGFLTLVFVQRVSGIVALGKKPMELAWERLSGSEAFVFYNMKPRKLSELSWPFGPGYLAEGADTAFWFTTFLAIGLVVAVMLSSNSREGPRFVANAWDRLAVACLLAAANWLIGSQWAIAASSLAP